MCETAKKEKKTYKIIYCFICETFSNTEGKKWWKEVQILFYRQIGED